ncbi:hypothetical protein KBA41_06320 [Candidatus Ozemobacteraceae bacterium]|nr:hypothetical protein [Candidatus Ozemobacteraceae bacterium]
MPCPAGVNIPGCFSLLNNAAMFEDVGTACFQYGMCVGEGKGSKCIECGACAVKRPQHIPIPGKLKDVVATLEPT